MPESAKTKALSHSLQQSLRRQRPSLLLAFLAIVALLSGGAALWYWLSTRPFPPDPLIVALDDIVVPGRDAELTAVFAAPRDADPGIRYQGRELLIKRMDEEDGTTHRASTDNRVRVPVAEARGDLPFVVQYRAPDRRQFPHEDQATLFRWPADARVVIVDADTTLFENDSDMLRPGATEALQLLRKSGLRIVYLALGAADAESAIPRRKELRLLQHDQLLPVGPIMLRLHTVTDSADAARAFHLGRLAKLFHHPPVAVVGTVEGVHQCRAVPGIAPLLLSDQEGLPEVPRCATWADVRRELATP